MFLSYHIWLFILAYQIIKTKSKKRFVSDFEIVDFRLLVHKYILYDA